MISVSIHEILGEATLDFAVGRRIKKIAALKHVSCGSDILIRRSFLAYAPSGIIVVVFHSIT